MKPFSISSLFFVLTLALAACGPTTVAGHAAGMPQARSPVAMQVILPTTTPTPFQPLPPTATWLPSSTFTVAPPRIPTPTWVRHAPGSLEAPILLYHHVGLSRTGSPYFVTPDDFRRQMERLRDWNYTPIILTQLAETIRHGGRLPERPVVITFDDGYRDIYDNAFPVMQELGFVGVFYLVSSQVSGRSFVRPSQVKKMIAAGWEIGNHSASHQALTVGYSAGLVQWEVIRSRTDLEELLDVEIHTFSYPYGLAFLAVRQQIKDLEYLAAVGVEPTWRHSENTLYYLGRLEVRGDFTLDDFAALLPWTGE